MKPNGAISVCSACFHLALEQLNSLGSGTDSDVFPSLTGSGEALHDVPDLQSISADTTANFSSSSALCSLGLSSFYHSLIMCRDIGANSIAVTVAGAA